MMANITQMGKCIYGCMHFYRRKFEQMKITVLTYFSPCQIDVVKFNIICHHYGFANLLYTYMVGYLYTLFTDSLTYYLNPTECTPTELYCLDTVANIILHIPLIVVDK